MQPPTGTGVLAGGTAASAPPLASVDGAPRGTAIGGAGASSAQDAGFGTSVVPSTDGAHGTALSEQADSAMRDTAGGSVARSSPADEEEELLDYEDSDQGEDTAADTAGDTAAGTAAAPAADTAPVAGPAVNPAGGTGARESLARGAPTRDRSRSRDRSRELGDRRGRDGDYREPRYGRNRGGVHDQLGRNYGPGGSRSMAASGRATAGLGPHLQRQGGPRTANPAPFVGPRTVAQRREDLDRQGQDLAADSAAGWEYHADDARAKVPVFEVKEAAHPGHSFLAFGWRLRDTLTPTGAAPSGNAHLQAHHEAYCTSHAQLAKACYTSVRQLTRTMYTLQHRAVPEDNGVEVTADAGLELSLPEVKAFMDALPKGAPTGALKAVYSAAAAMLPLLRHGVDIQGHAGQLDSSVRNRVSPVAIATSRQFASARQGPDRAAAYAAAAAHLISHIRDGAAGPSRGA